MLIPPILIRARTTQHLSLTSRALLKIAWGKVEKSCRRTTIGAFLINGKFRKIISLEATSNAFELLPVNFETLHRLGLLECRVVKNIHRRAGSNKLWVTCP